MKRYTFTLVGTIMCLLLAVAVPEEAVVILLYITGLWMGALSTIDVDYERLKPKTLMKGGIRKAYILEPRSKNKKLNKYI